MTVYSEPFRKRMVERMSGPRGVTAHALAGEVGVSQPTLSRWLREASIVEAVTKKTKSRKSRKVKAAPRASRRPADWSPEEKYRVVMASAATSDAELGAFLRREGLHDDDLTRFREEVRSAALAGLQVPRKPRGGATDDQKRIKVLERDLKRNREALAEAAALLVLRKKAVALWGEEGEDT